VHCPACGDAGEALAALPAAVVTGIEEYSLKRQMTTKKRKQKKPLSLESLESLEGTEVRVVAGDDARVSLRGQRGLFATRAWEPGETVAPYAAAVVTSREFDAALSALAGGGTLHERWRHQRFTVTTAGKVYVHAETTTAEEEEEEPLLFCALDESRSNATRFINDPTVITDPTTATTAATTAAVVVAAPNCQIVVELYKLNTVDP
jgi:hypothetical protein